MAVHDCLSDSRIPFHTAGGLKERSGIHEMFVIPATRPVSGTAQTCARGWRPRRSRHGLRIRLGRKPSSRGLQSRVQTEGGMDRPEVGATAPCDLQVAKLLPVAVGRRMKAGKPLLGSCERRVCVCVCVCE